MKSKKILMALAAIAAVSMSSCSQEEWVEPNGSGDNAIMFGTYIGQNPSARGTSTDTEALQNSKDGFGVFAYYTQTDPFGAESTPNFMYNQQVKYNAGATPGLWEYSPLKYWPNNTDEQITFFAYAPYFDPTAEGNQNPTSGIMGLSANTAKGDPTLSFKLPANFTEHIDLLCATGIMNQKKPGKDTKLNLNFQHALSRVNFQRVVLIDEVDNKALDPSTTITIDEVTFSLTNFATEGTLNLNTHNWEVTKYENLTYVLSPSNFKEGSNVLTSANSATVADLTKDGSYMMFIPGNQATEGNNATITIKYTVETVDAKVDGGKVTVKNTRTLPFKIAFTSGKSYNLVLKIGMTTVKLDAEVTDWTTGTTENWESVF